MAPTPPPHPDPLPPPAPEGAEGDVIFDALFSAYQWIGASVGDEPNDIPDGAEKVMDRLYEAMVAYGALDRFGWLGIAGAVVVGFLIGAVAI